MPFYSYLRIIQDVIFLISAGTAVFVKIKYGIKGNMQLLFWYNMQLTVGNIVSIAAHWFKIIDVDYFSRVLFASSILHYSLLSLFILSIEKPFMKTRAIKVYVALGITMAGLLLLVTSYRNTILLFSINNGTLFILSCIYFIRLFFSNQVIVVSREPSFCVVAGVFICMCVSLPFAAYKFFLLSNTNSQSSIYLILLFGYIIMHLFFIKAYLCLMKPT